MPPLIYRKPEIEGIWKFSATSIFCSRLKWHFFCQEQRKFFTFVRDKIMEVFDVFLKARFFYSFGTQFQRFLGSFKNFEKTEYN